MERVMREALRRMTEADPRGLTREDILAPGATELQKRLKEYMDKVYDEWTNV
jgi:type II secretory pathway predicted ATPase ExeA